MKKIIILAAIAFTTFTTEAQSKKGLFLDVRTGARIGGAVADNLTLKPGLNLQGGIGFMFNKYVGIKGDLGFNTFSSDLPLKPDAVDRSYVFRSSLQGILSISELAHFNIKNFGLNFHVGFGFSSFENPSWKKSQTILNDPYFKGNDDAIDIRIGLNPQYDITDHFSLDLDYTFNMFLFQGATVDRTQATTGITNFSTISVGLTYWFSSGKENFSGKGSSKMRFRKVKRFSKL